MGNLKRFAFEIQAVYKKKDNINDVKITGPHDVSKWVKNIFPVDINHREAFMVVFLNRNNNTIGHSVISTGGINSTVVDRRIILQFALLCNASAMILVHNHPSGSLKPSEADKSITKEICNAGRIMDIQVLDHIIITENSHFSFSDEGLI